MDAALPVCLAPWVENPYTPVSLWDMLRLYAHDFCRASGIFGQVYAQVKSGVQPADGSWGMVAGELGALERACENLGLISTLAQVRRLKPIFVDGGSVNWSDLARDVMEVQTRLIDELRVLGQFEPPIFALLPGPGKFEKHDSAQCCRNNHRARDQSINQISQRDGTERGRECLAG
jgi:hypothetical protein